MTTLREGLTASKHCTRHVSQQLKVNTEIRYDVVTIFLEMTNFCSHIQINNAKRADLCEAQRCQPPDQRRLVVTAQVLGAFWRLLLYIGWLQHADTVHDLIKLEQSKNSDRLAVAVHK